VLTGKTNFHINVETNQYAVSSQNSPVISASLKSQYEGRTSHMTSASLAIMELEFRMAPKGLNKSYLNRKALKEKMANLSSTKQMLHGCKLEKSLAYSQKMRAFDRSWCTYNLAWHKPAHDETYRTLQHFWGKYFLGCIDFYIRLWI
jgi:hypothetical protein